MNPVNATMGTTIMVGLVFYQPLAYLASGTMILAGLSGTLFMERFFSKVLETGVGSRFHHKTQSEKHIDG